MTYDEIWKTVLADIELQVSRPTFLTWFKNSRFLSKDEKRGVAFVSLPNNFAKEWVKNKYHKTILGSIRSIDSSIKNINYVVTARENDSMKTEGIKKIAAEKKQTFQSPLLEFKIDPQTNLSPRYTFDSYIVGSSNELAFAAAQAIIKNVGKKYNPFFVYGGVGLGKTHLLQAMGNALREKNGDKLSLLYVTSEKFISDVVWALRNKRMEDIKAKYRDIDVLIIDDIQFIGGKPATELEFFYTFNALYEHNKQIIISSDRPPAAIPTLEERLRSRFEGGMVADIGYPDYEMRLAILKNKIQEQNVLIDEKVLEKIAEKVQKNIRELEGVLNRVVFYEQYKNEKIDEKKLDKIINETVKVSEKNITPNDIIRSVADFFEITPHELTDRSRKKEFVEPRQICMYLLRDMLKLSYPSIGSKLGKRDHTTVIHACEKIQKSVNENSVLNQKISMIRERITSG